MSTMSSLCLVIPADVEQLASARARVRRWLDEEVPDHDSAADLLAVASEFLLHAIVRAGGVGTVRLDGERSAQGVRLAVASDPVIEERPHAIGLPPDPLAPGATGRRMVEACCDHVEVLTGPGASAECWRALA